jgi:hypothetical protein
MAENYAAWVAAEAAFLSNVDDTEIAALYRSAKDGDRTSEKTLAGMTVASFGPPMRAMTPREQKADRACEILYWLGRRHPR